MRRFYRKQPPKKNLQLSVVNDSTVRVKMHKISNQDAAHLKKQCNVDDKSKTFDISAVDLPALL